MADNSYKLHIGDENANRTINYGKFEVQFPKNYTNNSAFIGQHKLTKPDSTAIDNGGLAASDWNKENAGKLMSCFEINWGNAIEGWRDDNDTGNTSEKAKNANWNDDYTFPDRINTSADLLRYIFMLRWKLENIQTASAVYSLSISPSSLTVSYKSTNQVTATATQSNTKATVSSYAWSLSNNKFSISNGQNTKTVTIRHDETLTSTWTLPNAQASTTQTMTSTTGIAKVRCTPGTPTENTPTPSSATLTCKAKWTDNHEESKSITVKSSGNDHGTQPTLLGYQWTITSGSSYATLSDYTSQTCTLTGVSTGTVKVKCTVRWSSGSKETSEVSITVPAPPAQNEYYFGITRPTASNFKSLSNVANKQHVGSTLNNINGKSATIDSEIGSFYFVCPANNALTTAQRQSALTDGSFNYGLSKNIDTTTINGYYIYTAPDYPQNATLTLNIR